MCKGDVELLSPLLLLVSNTQSLSQPENRHPARLPFFLYLFGTESPRKPQGQEEGSQEWLCQVLGYAFPFTKEAGRRGGQTSGGGRVQASEGGRAHKRLLCELHIVRQRNQDTGTSTHYEMATGQMH